MANSMHFSPDGRSGASVGMTLEEAVQIVRAQPRDLEGSSAGLSATYPAADESERPTAPHQPSLFV
jgi:hypothetical protein